MAPPPQSQVRKERSSKKLFETAKNIINLAVGAKLFIGSADEPLVSGATNNQKRVLVIPSDWIHGGTTQTCIDQFHICGTWPTKR